MTYRDAPMVGAHFYHTLYRMPTGHDLKVFLGKNRRVGKTIDAPFATEGGSTGTGRRELPDSHGFESRERARSTEPLREIGGPVRGTDHLSVGRPIEESKPQPPNSSPQIAANVKTASVESQKTGARSSLSPWIGEIGPEVCNVFFCSDLIW